MIFKAKTKGLFDVTIDFTNIYRDPLRGVAIIDYIPFVYNFEIKQPTTKPESITKENLVNQVKWDVGIIHPSSSLTHQYALWEGKRPRSKEEEAAEKELKELENRFQKDLAVKKYDACLGAIPAIKEAAAKLGKQDVVERYDKLESSLKKEKEAAEKDTQARAELTEKLQQYEEKFQNDLSDRKYQECLKTIPQITDIAKQLDNQEIIDKYEKLRKQIEDNMTKESQLAATQQAKMDKMNGLKSMAADQESKLQFALAKKTYGSLKKLATESNDELTSSFCDQRIAQIEKWEKEIGESDLMKWDISPLRIINRLRHNFVQVLSDKAAAQARNAELQGQAKKGEVFQLLIMVRSKFTNQGPYNEKGECYCIYKRKELTE